jgi:hypothetical protein
VPVGDDQPRPDLVAERKKWRKCHFAVEGKNVNAFAQVESEAKTVEIRLLDYIRQIPMAAKS